VNNLSSTAWEISSHTILAWLKIRREVNERSAVDKLPEFVLVDGLAAGNLVGWGVDVCAVVAADRKFGIAGLAPTCLNASREDGDPRSRIARIAAP